MATIVGCAAMSHAPQLLTPPEEWLAMPARTKLQLFNDRNLDAELTIEARREKYDRCHKAIGVLADQIKAWSPDILIVVGDDQHENFFDDNMPAFAVYMADSVLVTRKMRNTGQSALDQAVSYPVSESYAKRLLDGLFDANFDPAWSKATRFEAGLGHAFGRALYLLSTVIYPMIPLMVNTYYPPAPSARRCYQFGQTIRGIVASWPEDVKVAVLASGGLSHTRVDEAFDARFIKALETHDAKYLSSLPADDLLEGTSEVRNWIIAAGIAGTKAKLVDYVACYRSAEGVGCGMGFAIWPAA
jgi:3-O-methylgallate 3,4-dioxygenase